MSSDLFVQFVSYGAFKLTICKKISGFCLLVKSYGNSCSWHFLVSGFTIDLLDSFKETHILWLERTFIKSFLWRPMSYFFLFFTHALPLSPTPQRTYGVKRLFPNFSRVTAFYRVGGRENSKCFWRRCTLFYEGTQKLQLLYYFLFFYFISFAKIKQTKRKNVGRDTATAVAN